MQPEELNEELKTIYCLAYEKTECKDCPMYDEEDQVCRFDK